FLLWIVGGGGGGDVKLMGALSVWLGFRLTLLVMIASTALVLIITAGVMVWSVLAHGLKASRKKYLATGQLSERDVQQGKQIQENAVHKQGRRLLPFAVPVALATWLVIGWKLPTLDNPVRGVNATPAASADVPNR